MKIELNEESRLVFKPNEENQPEEHIYIYRVSPLTNCMKESDAECFYIAVPNGKRIALRDLPEGKYVVERLNR